MYYNSTKPRNNFGANIILDMNYFSSEKLVRYLIADK